MFLTFPDDEKTYEMDNQHMVGDNLLIKPITDQGQSEISVYLPTISNWYNYMTKEAVQPDENGNYSMKTDLRTVPVFIRGGSIIPQRLRHRRSSQAMKHDPYTLLIALDEKNEAYGEFYSDDGKSFDYQRSFYVYRSFKFANNVLTSSKFKSLTDVAETEDESELLLISERVERIVILGMNGANVKGVRINYNGYMKDLEFSMDENNSNVITIKNPGFEIKDLNWKIEIIN
ncbi:hypothetical protein BCR36DRAFT_370725 [Piromyces finnis]|uniref:Glycosyl hydrolase family 31 C-terminal domain-containing protein n=1 Tax=Piromyces finnis TaxID=1754191 RepID=A0A1Y1V9L6_9FUNG|nr:hypothetical protein BCR36DRAFT_370725 [Piromyces finnis]|eukprot:ORX49715.1 hypothetical protein BCR36DRAFT_370725 [Piromyces finnis]